MCMFVHCLTRLSPKSPVLHCRPIGRDAKPYSLTLCRPTTYLLGRTQLFPQTSSQKQRRLRPRHSRSERHFLRHLRLPAFSGLRGQVGWSMYGRLLPLFDGESVDHSLTSFANDPLSTSTDNNSRLSRITIAVI